MSNKILCTICKDEFITSTNIVSTNCGHVYHSACIELWTQRSKTCPHCRLSDPTLSALFLSFDDEEEHSNLENTMESFMREIAIQELESQLENAIVDSSQISFEMEKSKLQESELKDMLAIKETQIRDLEASNLRLQEQLNLIKSSLLQMVENIN